MITDIASYLSFFDSLRRRTERDVAALPPAAVDWTPPAIEGEVGWTIGQIVGHIGSSRLYFASAYRNEGWIWDEPPMDPREQSTWLPWLETSAARFAARLKDTPNAWLARRIEMIDSPGRDALRLAAPDDDARARGAPPLADRRVRRPHGVAGAPHLRTLEGVDRRAPARRAREARARRPGLERLAPGPGGERSRKGSRVGQRLDCFRGCRSCGRRPSPCRPRTVRQSRHGPDAEAPPASPPPVPSH